MSERTETARVQDLRARIEETEAEIERLQDRAEDLQAEREDVKREYATALATGSVLDVDDLVERFTVPELREKVDDVRTERQEATLTDTEPALRAGATPTETARLSEDERERVAELEALLEDLPDRDDGLVARRREEIESELADLRGGTSP